MVHLVFRRYISNKHRKLVVPGTLWSNGSVHVPSTAKNKLIFFERQIEDKTISSRQIAGITNVSLRYFHKIRSLMRCLTKIFDFMSAYELKIINSIAIKSIE